MTGDLLYELHDVPRVYPGERRGARGRRHRPHDRPGRAPGDRGSERLGQEHAAPAARRARPPDGGLARVRRAATSHARRTRSSPGASRDVGFVFQTFNLIPTLSAAENVEAAMVPLHRTCHQRQASRRRAARAGRARRPRRTSPVDAVGRRAAARRDRARARERATCDPRRRADREPGQHDRRRGRGTLRALSREHGVTVIVVTHAEEVALHAERRVRLRDGSVVEHVACVSERQLEQLRDRVPVADRGGDLQLPVDVRGQLAPAHPVGKVQVESRGRGSRARRVESGRRRASSRPEPRASAP